MGQAAVDGHGPGAGTAGHLGSVEMATAGPVPPASRHPGGRGLGRPASRPAVRHPPGIEPLHDLVQPGGRAVAEQCPGLADHSDLGAHPALVVHAGQPVPRRRGQRFPRGGAGQPGGVGRPAECPRRPGQRDELGHVTAQRVPHQVARPAQAGQGFRRFPRGGAHRVPRQDQPDSSWDATLQAAAIGGGQDSLGPWHPGVSHDAPSSGLDLLAVPLPEYVRAAL